MKIMVKIVIKALVLAVLISGCKSIQSSHTDLNSELGQVVLGSIGEFHKNLVGSEFSSIAIPSYSEPIKLSAKVRTFTKSTYKTFLEAEELQAAEVDFKLSDSSKAQPKYLELKIADKVALLTELNDDSNQKVKNYLSHNTSSNVISGLSIVFNRTELDKIQHADAVFLIEKGLKNYALQLYENGSKTDIIWFNQGVIFGIETLDCCWQENRRNVLNIVDLTGENNKCPNSTYESAQKAMAENKKIEF